MSIERTPEKGEVADASLMIPRKPTQSSYDELVEEVKRSFGDVVVHRSYEIREPNLFVGETGRSYNGEVLIRYALRGRKIALSR